MCLILKEFHWWLLRLSAQVWSPKGAMQLLVMRVILEFRICFIVIEILLLGIMLGLQYPKLNLTACLAKTVANRLNALLRELINNRIKPLLLSETMTSYNVSGVLCCKHLLWLEIPRSWWVNSVLETLSCRIDCLFNWFKDITEVKLWSSQLGMQILTLYKEASKIQDFNAVWQPVFSVSGGNW